ncbi:MAG TPA: hypothetical protein VF646_10915 [Cytophagales bacterium]
MLSPVDEKQSKVIAKEKRLRDLHERILMGVAARHGKDSTAYEKAGGTRKSERKKPKLPSSPLRRPNLVRGWPLPGRCPRAAGSLRITPTAFHLEFINSS